MAAVEEQGERSPAGGAGGRDDDGLHLDRPGEAGELHRVEVVLAGDRAVPARSARVHGVRREWGRGLRDRQGVPRSLAGVVGRRVQPASGRQDLKILERGGSVEGEPERVAVLGLLR